MVELVVRYQHASTCCGSHGGGLGVIIGIDNRATAATVSLPWRGYLPAD